MNRRFGKIPPEPPRIALIDHLAPYVAYGAGRVIGGMHMAGYEVMPFETLRTDARQEWLFQFGRTWDDGRGKVTRASTGDMGWHKFGFALDIVENDSTPWVASQQFWSTLGRLYEENGFTWGGRWKRLDLPHGQWKKCPVRPTPEDLELYRTEGLEALWDKYRP